jgi:type I restriction enzyme S subunit
MNVIDDRERGSAGQAQGGGMRQGWTWKPLGEVCKTGSGGTPLSSRKEFYESGTIPWLVSGEVAQGNVREAKNFITAAGLENSAAKLFPRDTVLVAIYGATAGQVGILRFEATTNQAVCGILPNDKFVPEFLYYFPLAKKDDLVAQATGNAQPNISQIKIKNTAVPVLPLPEQQRIVDLLDEAFAGLAAVKANAEQNLQNARAIFESHLQSVFSERGGGWEECLLEELTEPDSPITYGVVKPGPEGEIRFVRGGDLVAGKVRLTQLRTITREVSDQYRRTVLQGGKLLICLVGQPGQVGVVPVELSGANIARQDKRLYLGSPERLRDIYVISKQSAQAATEVETLAKHLTA